MAQRTGDKRLLTPPAKVASAGAALALPVAALLLCGCGGGSSADSTSSSPGEGTTASAQGGGGSAGSGQGQGAGSSKQGEGGGGAQSDPTAQGGSSSGSGQKHGPHIAQPKGQREQAPTPAEVAKATVADMTLQSPGLAATAEGPARLPATYTCDGKDSWPTLRWSGVPAGTAELILYAMNVAPVEGKLFVDWAVAGLSPSLEGVEAGQLPKGAIVGTNSFGKQGYSICPPSGSGEVYIFAVYALPKALSPAKGFDARELRRQVLDVSGDVGLLSAYYARG